MGATHYADVKAVLRDQFRSDNTGQLKYRTLTSNIGAPDIMQVKVIKWLLYLNRPDHRNCEVGWQNLYPGWLERMRPRSGDCG